jgi:LysM repeat protein
MIKLLVLVSISFFNPTTPKDSIGVEIISGKTFVVHKVSQGETLYGISKRYGVSLEQILEFNPTADGGLEIDQILKIPFVPRARRPKDETIHKVGDNETLYSISKLYGVSIEEIKQWNNLTDNGLTLGRELVIKKKNTVPVSANTPIEIKPGKGVHTVAPKETVYSIARQYGITRDQLKEWNGLQSDELSIGQNLMVIQPIYSKSQNTTTTTETIVVPPVQVEKPVVSITPVEKVPTIRISENVKGSDEVLEGGLAELIESTEANRKYLALHRTAPVGTILKVRNEMNNREVFVRVIGKLPDNAMTDKVIIRVSKSAYDRLGAIDPRFRVEVTYYK